MKDKADKTINLTSVVPCVNPEFVPMFEFAFHGLPPKRQREVEKALENDQSLSRNQAIFNEIFNERFLDVYVTPGKLKVRPVLEASKAIDGRKR